MSLAPNRERMNSVSQTLRLFLSGRQADDDAGRRIIALLGNPTQEKRWLVASLDKTIRFQLNPPSGMQALSALEGPAWIRE